MCATLNKDIDSKVEHDINRLKETTSFDVLVICSSKDLTEYHIENLKKQIREGFKVSANIEILGQAQLAKLSERHPDIFKKYYQLELQNVVDLFSSVKKGEETIEHKGLRLALSSFVHNDAAELRKSMMSKMVLEAIVRGENQDIQSIAKKISDEFHLPKVIQPSYVENILKELAAKNMVTSNNGKWSAAPEGIVEATTVSKDAVYNLLEALT